MSHRIRQKKVTDEMKKRIFAGFAREAILQTGMDGLTGEAISFEIFEDSQFMGVVIVEPFWEQLHIKYLFVEELYRNRGIGRKLMKRALEFGKKKGYHFAFVETMNFQAPDFYQKLGFVMEFSRTGFAKGTSLHYLRKML